jgi:hypothetical protein
MLSILLRKFERTWSGRRDSNPRPLPWQGETGSFSKYAKQPLIASFRSHFYDFPSLFKVNQLKANSINLKIGCHLMPPSICVICIRIIIENAGGHMGKKDIYLITVLNWPKHNGNMKRGHKASLIQNNFCSDAKLRTVPVTVRWLFLGIVLTCGDHTRDTVEMSESQVRDLLESSWSIGRALESLKQLRLLTYEKNAPLLTEENRKEEKRIEEEKTRVVAPAPQKSPTTEKEFGCAPGLQGNLLLDQVIHQVAQPVQKSWADTYETGWLKMCLIKAIEHHMTRHGAQTVTEVTDWPKKFSAWLKNERAPKFKPKPVILRPKDPDTPWPTGAKERALGSVSAVKAMSKVAAKLATGGTS